MKLKNEFIRLTPKTRLYQLNIPIIGLTGGIASGKSTVSKELSAKGFYVIDADQLVKSIYNTQEAFNFVSSEFPTAVTDSNINFKILRQKVFLEKNAKELVEKFIYQRLPEAFMNEFRKLKNPECIIYDVPLLFEKKIDALVDVNVLVYAPRKIQLNRLITRDGHVEEMANNIIGQQMDIEAKKNQAQFVIDNSETTTNLIENINQFLHQVFI